MLNKVISKFKFSKKVAFITYLSPKNVFLVMLAIYIFINLKSILLFLFWVPVLTLAFWIAGTCF